jgi:lysophospholipase L1-like esterase
MGHCYVDVTTALIAAPGTAVAAFALMHRGARRALFFAARETLARIFPPRLVIVGDSLAEQPDWGKLAGRPLGALNFARGGATLKEIGAQIVAARAHAAPWLLIDGGLNDLLFDEAPLEQLDHDFRALLRRIGPGQRAIYTLMPHVGDARHAPRIDAANAHFAGLCAERGIRVVDLNPMVSDKGARRAEMSYDGLHFSRAADAVWLAALRETLA